MHSNLSYIQIQNNHKAHNYLLLKHHVTNLFARDFRVNAYHFSSPHSLTNYISFKLFTILNSFNCNSSKTLFNDIDQSNELYCFRDYLKKLLFLISTLEKISSHFSIPFHFKTPDYKAD